MGINFVGKEYYEGKGLMIRKDMGVEREMKIEGD